MGDKSRSDVENAILEAAALPINDAAHFLLSQCYRLDRSDRAARSESVIAEADVTPFDREIHELRNSTTFRRLQLAHPQASLGELERAIDLAVKLNHRCAASFSYSSQNYFEDVSNAIEKTKRENPDLKFQESTYHRIELDMLKAYR